MDCKTYDLQLPTTSNYFKLVSVNWSKYANHPMCTGTMLIFHANIEIRLLEYMVDMIVSGKSVPVSYGRGIRTLLYFKLLFDITLFETLN